LVVQLKQEIEAIQTRESNRGWHESRVKQAWQEPLRRCNRPLYCGQPGGLK
jgi:hypothetical protein